MSDIRYTKSHEWVRVDGATATIGISDHAQKTLGDVVFVELPKVGQKLEADDSFGTIESVKAASELYAPVGGEVIAINEDLTGSPEIVNDDPAGNGWMIRLKLSNPGELKGLMDQAAYDAFLKSAED